MKGPKTWIATVNRAGAVIYATGPRGRRLTLIDTFVSEEGRLRTRDVYADRGGRFACDGARGGSGDLDTDLNHQAGQRLAKEVVARLESGRQAHAFDHLVVVAAPMMLGMLRDEMPRPLMQLVLAELDKDLANLKPHDLQQRLLALVSDLPRARGFR